jgi:hypothetical protein
VALALLKEELLEASDELAHRDALEALVEVDEENVSVVDDKDEVEAWVVVVVVLDVTDPGLVASEETEEVGVDVPVEVEDAEVAVLWVPASKKAEPRKAITKIARTAPTTSLLITAQGSWGIGEY